MDKLAPNEPTRVLIVDDNRDAADTLALLMRLHGYDAVVAYTGTAALGAAKSYDPDLVMLDLTLPDFDGLDVARRLRGPDDSRPSIVAVSGRPPEGAEECSSTYFDEFLRKPVARDALVAILARVGLQQGQASAQSAPRT